MTAGTSLIVIVGAGHAGGRLAERLRHFGHDGEIVLIGEEPYAPYERPPLSKAVLTEDSTPGPATLCDPAALAIDHRPGRRVTGLDRAARRLTLEDGSEQPYGTLVLATGLAPRRLPVLDLPGVSMTLRTYADALSLRARLSPGMRLAIVGAGFVGLEVAASARQLGVEVSLMESAERPLARAVPVPVSDWLVGAHRAHGAKVMCEASVAAASGGTGGVHLTLTTGARIEADLLLQGIGSVPATDLAAGAGLCGPGQGIEVDAEGRTLDPAIFAIGDIACRPGLLPGRRVRLESWRNAEETASRAALAICGLPAESLPETPWFWTDQYGHNLQLAGLPGTMARLAERGKVVEPGYLAYLLEGDRLVGAIALDAGRDMRKARKLMDAGARLSASDLARSGFTAPAATVPVP